MSLKAFLADSVLSGGRIFKDTAILCNGGQVAGMVANRDIPLAAEKIDLSGLTLAAGLVDAQVNGGGGVLFNDMTSTVDLEKISAAHMRSGTTAFLPTLITDRIEKICHAMDATRQFRQKNGPKKCGLIGLHLEGPFINPARSGIHEKGFMQRAAADFLDDADLKTIGVLLVTLAPEMLERGTIKNLTARGAIIAAGHSAANKETLLHAKTEGLTGITHLFNAMGGMSAREPGLSGLALDDNDLSCSIIADGAHVAPEMLRIAAKAKPSGKLFFVSDAMPPAGDTQMKSFPLQGKEIFVRDGKCVDTNDQLAGSALTLFECLRYAVTNAGLPLEHAHAMASLYPAQFLKVEKDYGSLNKGCRADIIAFDRAFNLEKVFIAGTAL